MVGRTNAGGKAVRLLSIAVTTPPDQTEYSGDDALDLTGMVITATYSDGTTKDVTNQCTFSPANGAILTENDTEVTATFKGLTTTQAITVSSLHIYGVYWDGSSSPAWTRTDDAANFTDPNPYYAGMSGTPSSPFDNLMPWSGMVRVTDAEAGELVVIPKFWYKWTRDGNSMKLQIATQAVDGFLVSPAHADRGDGKGERDVVYVGRYHCSGDYSEDIYKSKTGSLPLLYIDRSEARSSIHNLGSTIWQWDYAMLWTIRMLYLVEFANWNSQEQIGYGCGNDSDPQLTGASDDMTYHTGTIRSSRTTYGVGCQYRYIEDLWGNCYDWCDGIYCISSTEDRSIAYHGIKNPALFSDSYGGTLINDLVLQEPAVSYCIMMWSETDDSKFDYALFPLKSRCKDYTTYVCDEYNAYIDSLARAMGLCVGGPYDQEQLYGLFSAKVTLVSDATGRIGCRLMKLP